MPYRPLGRCGTKVSAFGLGGWTTFGELVTDRDTVRATLHAAFTAGINFFDIADVYANGEAERIMGSVLREFPRHRLVISTKVFFPMSRDVNDRGLSRKHIVESIHKSLHRIGTDYVDIYFCHRPDRETPVEETARAMDDLVHQGKALYWGTSEWSGEQIKEVHRLCQARNLYPPQVEQPNYSLLMRARFENDVRPAATERGMGLAVFSPLAYGLLTGKYDDGIPDDSRLGRIDWLRDHAYTEDRISRVRRFKAIADEAGCTRAQLALAWTLSRPGVSSVLLGARGPEQLHENLGALSVPVTEDISAKLDTLFPPGRA
ncbi:MAG: aldo/keto reductase family protein [Phycisphaerae bacterium]|nr:aldo/keto reductase family protein [Phycisphaerae bacterium]